MARQHPIVARLPARAHRPVQLAHADAAVTLRRARLLVPRQPAIDEVEQRDLSVYDALGEVAI